MGGAAAGDHQALRGQGDPAFSRNDVPASGRQSGFARQRSTRRRYLYVLALAAATYLTATIWLNVKSRSQTDWIEVGRVALQAGDAQAAIHASEQALATDAGSYASHLIAAQANIQLGEIEQAAKHFESAERLSPPEALREILQAHADSLIRADAIGLAEAPLTRLASLPNPSTQSIRQLVAILQLEARRREAAPWVMELIRRDEASVSNMSYLGNPDQMTNVPEEVERLVQGSPTLALPLIGAARCAVEERNDYAEAEELLRTVARRHPENVEAWAQLAWVFSQTAQWEELARCIETCPSVVQRHPVFWVARGAAYEHLRADAPAARCYWEALRLDPDQLHAGHQLPAILHRLGRGQEAAAFETRTGIARDVLRTIRLLSREPEDVEYTLRIARGMEQLGRLWEAWAWYGRLLELQGSHAEARSKRAELRSRLTADSPQMLPEAIPALQIDLSDYTLPEHADERFRVSRTSLALTPESNGIEATQPEERAITSGIRFVDETQTVGLHFSYRNSAVPETTGERIQETTGGGVGVLDFDLDGWADLYLTQGSDWPPNPEQSRYLDCLFRNDFGERVVDVAAHSGVREAYFGQGIACGDVNLDGLSDLYVANIGPNTLWFNQGDGTFRQVALPPKESPLCWTTSCLLADLNADGAPDIYDAGYVTGPDVYERICNGIACAPTAFAPQRDRLLLSLGDDGFAETTDEAGLPPNDGNGLGVVAWPDDESGRLNLFVANDLVNNMFLVQQERTRGGAIRLQDDGILSGLAFDAEGTPQACMGIATDDADGDGTLDLFVTNFFRESNTLYLCQGRNSFLDATRPAGLRAPSFFMNGFGTQFLDADLDGWPDLVISNGHVVDHRSRDEPYRMRPQFMRNQGGAKFVEIPAEQLGPFFVAEHLGRGLARLDFDRDGKEDFAVSHLHEPAALVRNATEQTGHALRLQLRGVASNRDALGAVLTIRTRERTIKKFMTAGGGYMACNEMQIIAGLGPETEVQELSILWPSGVTQSCGPLPADTPLLWVEGRPTPVVMPLE